MKLRYKYRLFPNEQQIQQLKQCAGSSRYIWNYFLNRNINQYKLDKTFIFYSAMCKELTSYKQQNNWLLNIHSQTLQQKIKDLDQALKNCFKYKRGFPKYKKKSNYNDSFRYSQGIKLNENKVYLPKIGWIKQDTHRKIISKPTSATIILDGNKWYISYVVEVEEQKPKEIKEIVGIDLGIKSFITTSDGIIYDNQKLLDKSLVRLKRKQRSLSKKQKGSNNSKKQQLIVYNQHKKIRNQRHNYTHQISAQITNEYDLICIENLNVKGMMANHKLSKAIGQIGWSMLCSQLEYKSKIKGKKTIKINRYEPSSKTCSSCGNKKDMPLDIREYICPDCGLVMDRDANASINIRNWGYRDYTAGTAGIKACGVHVSHRSISADINDARTMKQESIVL